MSCKRNMIAGLAFAGLLVTNAAFADEIVTTESVDTASVTAVELDRDLLKQANEAAAKKAVDAVLADTKLDLDIRLIGPTSVKIAGDR